MAGSLSNLGRLTRYLPWPRASSHYPLDSDGNGWIDLDERLRYAYPDDAANEPLDYDQDVRDNDPLPGGLPFRSDLRLPAAISRQ